MTVKTQLVCSVSRGIQANTSDLDPSKCQSQYSQDLQLDSSTYNRITRWVSSFDAMHTLSFLVIIWPKQINTHTTSLSVLGGQLAK